MFGFGCKEQCAMVKKIKKKGKWYTYTPLAAPSCGATVGKELKDKQKSNSDLIKHCVSFSEIIIDILKPYWIV